MSYNLRSHSIDMFSIQIDTKVFLYARLIDALEYDLMDHNSYITMKPSYRTILTYAIFTAKSINWANLWFLSAWQLLFLWCLRNSNILFLPITILLIVCSFYYPYLGLNTAFLLASLKVCRPSFADSIYLRQSISFYALHSCLGSINLFRRLGSFSNARIISKVLNEN